MTYKEYGLEYGTYVAHKTQGLGFVEDPINELEIIAHNENYQELVDYCESIYSRKKWKNMESDISYCININTSTETGKKYLKAFDEECNNIRIYRENNPELWSTYTAPNGMTFHIMKDKIYDK